MSGRSKKSNHYGTLCERKVARKRRFELARASWKDAEFQNGTPVEIKSAMSEHADGQPGTFKLYREYHEKLRREDGWYAFAVYKVRGKGVTLLDEKMVHSSNIPTLQWHGGGDHRGTEQAKLAIEDVFR